MGIYVKWQVGGAGDHPLLPAAQAAPLRGERVSIGDFTEAHVWRECVVRCVGAY